MLFMETQGLRHMAVAEDYVMWGWRILLYCAKNLAKNKVGGGLSRLFEDMSTKLLKCSAETCFCTLLRSDVQQHNSTFHIQLVCVFNIEGTSKQWGL